MYSSSGICPYQPKHSPERLIEFLKNETDGYRTIMSGSSAGYAAILYGSILKSRKGICFQSSSRIDIPINKE